MSDKTSNESNSETTTLSHEDALSAVKDLRHENAAWRTKYRDAEQIIKDLESKTAQQESAYADKVTALQRQWLEKHTDMPLWAIENRCEIADLYTEDGSLDLDKLKRIEADLSSELSKRSPKPLKSGAHRDIPTKSPGWSDLMQR